MAVFFQFRFGPLPLGHVAGGGEHAPQAAILTPICKAWASDLGVAMQRDGSLQFNAARLDSALAATPSQICSTK